MKAWIWTLFSMATAMASAQDSTIVPTAFEAYATAASAQTRWTHEIGRLQSSDATLTLVALIVEDAAAPPSEMRGVRFELVDNTAVDHVYLDREQLVALRDELEGFERGIPRLRDGPLSQWRVQGTGACWMPPEPIRILCPSYRVGPDGEAFTLAPMRGHTFVFPGRLPVELDALIASALAALDR